MQTASSVASLILLGLIAPILVSGLKASIMHDGPGMFELAGMLWRGEIRSRKRC